jgi:hypothetical protein
MPLTAGQVENRQPQAHSLVIEERLRENAAHGVAMLPGPVHQLEADCGLADVNVARKDHV